MLSLREEILVVMRYEMKKVPNGQLIGHSVALFRQNIGDNRLLFVREMRKELQEMAKEGYLHPWAYSAGKKKLMEIENIDSYDARTLYYTLTYRGYRAHLDTIERLVSERGDFRALMRKKPGQS